MCSLFKQTFRTCNMLIWVLNLNIIYAKVGVLSPCCDSKPKFSHCIAQWPSHILTLVWVWGIPLWAVPASSMIWWSTARGQGSSRSRLDAFNGFCSLFAATSTECLHLLQCPLISLGRCSAGSNAIKPQGKGLSFTLYLPESFQWWAALFWESSLGVWS